MGGIELSALACRALDRAESLREQIDRGGEVIATSSTNCLIARSWRNLNG